MIDSTNPDFVSTRLLRGIVLRVREEPCDIVVAGQSRVVRYATRFPSPRLTRVSPGHLVAIATTREGAEAIVWRWYDAVVLSQEENQVRVWEPAHGEVLAQPRRTYRPSQPGTRAYLSAGLPGADWWVAGPVMAAAEDADVELDEVERIHTEHDLWDNLI